MEPTEDKPFSFPNSDQDIPGVTDSSRPQREVEQKRPTVNILDAINAEKPIDADLQRIHTYQGDLTSAIKDDSFSMIKVALAEKKRQERQGGQMQLEESNSKKPLLIGVIVISVIVVLALIYFFVIILVPKNNTPTENTAQPTSLLYTENYSSISVDQRDSDDITRLIKRELGAEQDLGSMKSIFLISGTGTSTREITTGEFLKGLGTSASDSLIRSLGSQFLLGIYYFNPEDFFFLVKVNSYDTAFAGMLQWEPDIENDIGNILITRKPTLPVNLSATTTASTTTPVGPLYSGRIWVDRVIDNKDARVLVDTDGNPAMLYTFLDKNTLVISSSDKALKEISFRLTAGRIVR